MYYVLVYKDDVDIDCHIITQECNQVNCLINSEDDIELITRNDQIIEEKICNGIFHHKLELIN